MKRCGRHLGIAFAVLFVLAVIIFYAVIGENSYIAVQDNMDLFVAQFAMLKNTGTFFSHNVAAPFLKGVSRDVLPSELSLYSLLYAVLPSFAAYITGYVLKVVIAIISCRLLFLDMVKEKNEHTENLATLTGLLYGVLNLFPAFGIPFAVIPLIIYLLRKVYYTPSLKWYVLVFLYPFVSYFSYIGFFIIGYLFVAVIIFWIRDRKFPAGLFISLMLLSLGSFVFEYRLFTMMLFSDTVTIRDTMVQTYLGAGDIMGQIADVFVNGMMHVEDVHKFLLLPICAVYFVVLNAGYIIKKNVKGIFTDIYNLCVLLLFLDCLVYGLYYSEFVNNLIKTLVPPLTGFQYNRTIFFNPFIWCAMLFIIVYRLSLKEKKVFPALAYVLVFACGAVVLLSPTRYNDLYNTAFYTARQNIFGNVNDDLNYREFYSAELFDEIKKDIGYSEYQWGIAYGMHPAILEYNGIATLDGYLGFYPQSYKEQFRQVIAPALERKENSRIYFDEWGARCYLYSGTDDTIVMATKSMMGVTDTNIFIDGKALKDLGCSFLFSRINISNCSEAGLSLIGGYSGYNSPYTVYVYAVD